MSGVDRSELRQKVPLTLTPNDHLFKNGDLSGIWGNAMEIDSHQRGIHGAYWKGMRHLSLFLIFIDGKPPLPITPLTDGGNGSSPFLFTSMLLGPTITSELSTKRGDSFFVDGPLLLSQRRFCLTNGFEDEVRLENHAPFDIRIPFSLEIDADFRDIMDIRGIRSQWPPHNVERISQKDTTALLLTCLCEDKIRRNSLVHVLNHGIAKTDKGFEGEILIPAKGSEVIRTSCRFSEKSMEPPRNDSSPTTISRLAALDKKKERLFNAKWAGIHASTSLLGRWKRNALRDLRILLTPQPTGPYPYAGVPWFSTPFGRDALITGFFSLWANPELSKSILAFLSKHQAKHVDTLRDAQPGKILHEYRFGEAAKDPRIPFSSYYGSVDSTPLFVALAAAYFQQTKNQSFLSLLRPSLDRAMEWIDRFGLDPTSGFLVYSGDLEGGLVQKGWKDSGDSIFHSDGRIASHPIALPEVQGYLYMAYLGYSMLLSVWGEGRKSRIYKQKALKLKDNFNDCFWRPSIRMFALAVDGKGHPCEVRSSNAGHVLFTGIAKHSLARMTGKEIMAPDMFSGFGIRTIGINEIRYNPVSYHNGSVWPHDNALIIEGLRRYGMKNKAKRLANAYLSTLASFPGERPPELYCVFAKESTATTPLPYPTSCRIQAWSVSSVFLVLHSLQEIV